MNQALGDYGSALRRRWRWVALGALLALVGSIAALLIVRPMFASQATVFIRTPGDVSKSIDGGDTYARHRAATYVGLANSPDIAAEVADSLGIDTDPDTLSARISARNEPNSVLIDVSVRASDADEAQRTASAFLSAFAKRVNDLESVDGSVAPRAELVVVDLPDRPLHRSVFGVPIALVLLVALLGGAALGALAATMRFIFDQTVRDMHDVGRITGLATIEQSSIDADMTLTARALLRELAPLEGGVILVTPADPAATSSVEARKLATALTTLARSATATAVENGADVEMVSRELGDLRMSSRWVVAACPPALSSIDVDLLARESSAIVLLVTLGRIDEDTVRRAGAVLPADTPAVVLATTSAPDATSSEDEVPRSIEEGADA